MLVTGEEFAIEACKWINVPFLHQGRSRQGIDCFGILTESARAKKLSEYDVTGYGTRPPPDWIINGLKKHLDVCTNIDRVGAVLVFGFGKKKAPQHFAIRTPYGMVHTNAQLGRCHHHDFDQRWRDRVVSCWTVPGVID